MATKPLPKADSKANGKRFSKQAMPSDETHPHLDFLRVTEAAALSSSRWVGKGEKDNADEAACDAMRRVLNDLEIDGTIVIGEGERDEAPMLYIGEKVGKQQEGDPLSLIHI